MTIETAFNALAIAVLSIAVALGILLAISARRQTAAVPSRRVVIQLEANTTEFVRALRAAQCAVAGGHHFPRVEHRRLCDPDVEVSRGACTRCGTLPDRAEPLLWEGDQS